MPTVRRTLVLGVTILAAVTVAFGPATATASGLDEPVRTSDALLGGAANPVNDTIDDTTDTTTDTTDDTTDTTTDTTDDTTDTTTDTVDDTTDTTTDTTDDTTDTTTDTVDDTTDTVDDTTGGTTEPVSDTVDDTTNTTADAVDDTTDTLAETLDATVDGTTDLLDSSSDTLTGTVERLSTDVTGAIRGVDDGETSVTRPPVGPAGERSVSAAQPMPDVGRAAIDGSGSGGGSGAGLAAAGLPGRSTGLTPGEELPDRKTGGVLAMLAGLAAAATVRQSATLAGARTGLTGTVRDSLDAAAVATRRAGTSALDRLVRMFTPLRYSRYDGSDPLEHEAREAILETVEESPGTYLSAVTEEVDMPLSTTRHHIKVLEREGILTRARLRGRRRLYPAHATDVELAAAMNDEATARLLDALGRLGAAPVNDLAEELDRSSATVTHHLQRMEEDGLVVRERDGRAVVNRLAPGVRDALADAEESEEDPSTATVSAD